MSHIVHCCRKRPTCCVVHVPQSCHRLGDIHQPAGLVKISARHMALVCPGTPLGAVNAGVVPVEGLQESIICECRVDVLHSSACCQDIICHTGTSCMGYLECVTASTVRNFCRFSGAAILTLTAMFWVLYLRM